MLSSGEVDKSKRNPARFSHGSVDVVRKNMKQMGFKWDFRDRCP